MQYLMWIWISGNFEDCQMAVYMLQQSSKTNILDIRHRIFLEYYDCGYHRRLRDNVNIIAINIAIFNISTVL